MRKEHKRLEWAQKIIQQELDMPVIINDDNSRPCMYDLRVGPSDEPEIAVEVTGAVNEKFTETWNVGSSKGMLRLPIKSDWIVEIADGTHIQTFKQKISDCLQMLESQGLFSVRLTSHFELRNPTIYKYLESLGITSVNCVCLPGTGKVYYFNMPQSSEHKQGSSVHEWIGAFLRDPARQDVLSKLERSGASAHEVFILVELYGAPYEVESYLMGDLSQIPNQAPDLPSPVSGVWIVPTIHNNGKGLRWNGNTWHTFRTIGEGIDD